MIILLALLAIIPWVLTVGALLFIIVRSKKEDKSDELNDFIQDEQAEEIIRVAVYEDKAYWVYDNVFYESDTIREPDFATARPIDTMSMSGKQLRKLLSILDELEEQGKE